MDKQIMGEEESVKPGHECGGCGVWVYPADYCPECAQGPAQPGLKEIWETLVAVDVKDHLQERGNFTYLSWSWAWGVLMEQYPQARYEFPLPTFYEDGSIEVHCQVFIGPHMREMWLPVMDHKNKAIKQPDALAINKAKMRCLVKCIAMFGLGHYIYAGEDVPTTTLTKAKSRKIYDEISKGICDQTSFDDVKSYAEEKKDIINTMPVDWQDMIRVEFKEGLAFWRDQEMKAEKVDGSTD